MAGPLVLNAPRSGRGSFRDGTCAHWRGPAAPGMVEGEPEAPAPTMEQE
jgi:hypothetical protein